MYGAEAKRADELKREEFWGISQMGVTSGLVSLSKTESHNMRELIARYIITMEYVQV